MTLAVEGTAAEIDVPGAPEIKQLHAEFIERGGRFFACPVCVNLRGLQDATLVPNAEVKGAPAMYEFTQGGALGGVGPPQGDRDLADLGEDGLPVLHGWPHRRGRRHRTHSRAGGGTALRGR